MFGYWQHGIPLLESRLGIYGIFCSVNKDSLVLPDNIQEDCTSKGLFNPKTPYFYCPRYPLGRCTREKVLLLDDGLYRIEDGHSISRLLCTWKQHKVLWISAYPDKNVCTTFVNNVVDAWLFPSILKCYDSGYYMCDFLSCIDDHMYSLPLSFGIILTFASISCLFVSIWIINFVAISLGVNTRRIVT